MRGTHYNLTITDSLLLIALILRALITVAYPEPSTQLSMINCQRSMTGFRSH